MIVKTQIFKYLILHVHVMNNLEKNELLTSCKIFRTLLLEFNKDFEKVKK